MNQQSSGKTMRINRRGALKGAVAAGAAAWAGAAPAPLQGAEQVGATKGRINQSLVNWCYKEYWDVPELAKVAVKLGCKSIELVAPEHWPVLKEHGLVCALAPGHTFAKGMNNPTYQPECIQKMRDSIDACAEFGFPSVITFTGFAENISAEDGMRNCVEGYKKIIGHAEEKGVNLCLEMLNSRVDITMKGHPGYQGDHTEYCIEIIKQVGSPRMKLLFDIYHVQIMDGDVIRRIREHKDFIGHYHTAGNPGRGELDQRQEINYAPIMEEIVKTGYGGYVGQEFIPTRDALEGLREAVELCDV